MVITGKTRTNAKQLGEYLVTQGENERIEVLDVRGATSWHVPHAVLEFGLAAELTRGRKGLYHATIDPAYGEDNLTQEQWQRCADVLGEQLGLAGQPRVIVLHNKKGRTHAHVVWQRAKGSVFVSDSHSFRQHDKAREILEKEFSHKRTYQPAQVKNFLTTEWNAATSPEEFYSRITASGFRLAHGERRAYTVLTPEGLKLDLVRQLTGIKTAQVKERLAGLAGKLPHERDMKGRDRQSTLEQLRERRRIERDLKASIDSELGERSAAGEKRKSGPSDQTIDRREAVRQRMQDILSKQERDQENERH